jgi:hypothetical protein
MRFRWFDLAIPIVLGVFASVLFSLSVESPIPFIAALLCSTGILGIGWGLFRAMQMRRERDR